MGLKPAFQIKPMCPFPGCDYELRYNFRDPQLHPDNWAITAESYQHLNEAHIKRPALRLLVNDEPELLEVRTIAA